MWTNTLVHIRVGFESIRGTADAVWAHRWMISQVQHFKKVTYVLGIDLSKAFDTIDRTKLMEVLKNIVDEDSLRLIHLLLDQTSLQVNFGNSVQESFTSNIGTPQGD